MIKYGQRGSVMQEQMYFPEGGVGSFLTSNMDEMPDNVLAFGQPRGINSMGDVANRMAQMGRNGDTELAHVNRDEIIIDRNMARDPRIRNAMAEVFSDNDLDMARYTVGNAANSVNPYTGNREFFLKKIISGVKKIIKLAAPVVIPLALNFVTGGAYGALSMVAQGAISGGITSLVQGGNLKDALKGAAIGGFAGGLSAGVQGFQGAEGTFGQRFGKGVESFKGSVMDTFRKPDAGFILGESAKKFSTPSGAEGRMSTLSATGEQSAANARIGENLPLQMGENVGPALPKDIKLADYTTDGSFFKKPEITLDAARKYLTASGTPVNEGTLKMVMDQASGGYKILPTIGTTLGIGALAGGFDQIPAEEIEDPYDSTSPAEDRLAENPEKYTTGVPGAPSYRSLYDVMVPTVRQPIYQQFVEPVQTAARGGEMENFPRKTGYIAGPGTETSDSIPAMLSDGEFVMNAKAVRGAGGGSRERGVRKMYDMMRAFEGGAVA